MMNVQRLLERFLRYVEIDTTADESSNGYPSSAGQLELGRIVLDELRAMGLADARQDEHGIITATVPAAFERADSKEAVPMIAFCAHLDTSPETSGANVRPQVIHDYAGGDIVLPADTSKVIRTSDNPALDRLLGKTIITTDGTTLLGGDDKAGLAVIVEAAQWLLEHPDIKHGPVRLCFTCDEEIGRGTDHIDLDELDATACYTLDGEGVDCVDVETFSADVAIVTVSGVNIHPSIAKDRMTNAVRAAADFLQRLPADQSPETTEDRQGFLHPYEIEGGVGEVRIRIIIRDFDTAKLDLFAATLHQAASETLERFPDARIDITVKRQYRNMADGLTGDRRAVDYAVEALKRIGREAKTTIVRGGTDGSRLTEMGLPTPNLSNGSHNPHSNLEWACLEEMVMAGEWVISLAETWGEKS
ncbi:MAG: peptidase T [Pirellulales bacterium]|nr:peptidase T [Pirellulales bacterium]